MCILGGISVAYILVGNIRLKYLLLPILLGIHVNEFQTPNLKILQSHVQYMLSFRDLIPAIGLHKLYMVYNPT